MLPSPSDTAMVVTDKFFSITKKNFEPRVGLAWRLNESGKTVLRAGAGIYHNQIFPWAYSINISSPPFFGRYSAVSTATNPIPFPDGYKILGPGAIGLTVYTPVEKTPVDEQYNVSVQQEIFKNTVVQVSYAGNHANHLETLRETDTATPIFLPDGQPSYPAGAPRLNRAWAGIGRVEMNGNSVYNSLTVTLRKQSASGFQGQIFYTYSKAMDENSGLSNSDSLRTPQAVLDPTNIARDWARADFDSTLIVVANLSYAVPFRATSKAVAAVVNGWTLDAIGTFTSGMPFTARLASSVSRDLSQYLAERPNLNPGAKQNPSSGASIGCTGFPAGTPLANANNWYDPCSFALPLAGTYGNVGRNTITGPGVADVDLALEKSFKLRESADVKFRAEMFNVMNHTNLGLPNTNPLAASGAASPSAGRITYTTTSSRQLQFALRISF